MMTSDRVPKDMVIFSPIALGVSVDAVNQFQVEINVRRRSGRVRAFTTA
jgi:hypothetical protein